MINKKLKNRTLVLISVGVLMLVMGAAERNDFKAGKAIEVFYNVLRTVNLEYVDTVNNDKLINAATSAMLATLDPYTEYLDKEAMKAFQITTTGKYGGVGSIVKAPKDGGYASISTIYKDFPMYKAGVTPGDSIIAIDGESMKGLEVGVITDKMKGESGTIVKMTMRKLRTGKDTTYNIKREVVRISPVDYYGFVADSVGYISFSTFSADGAKDVRKAVADMQQTGKLAYLILDLRSNGGGLVNEAVDIVSLFVPKGSSVVSMRGRDKTQDRDYTTNSEPIAPNIPLAVMINSNSASASEIVAGALQDLDRAYIIGERSFGKGLVQSPKPVGYGSFVKVTIAKYYTPSGRCIQALDYTHRNEDGSVSHVPDSLISEFSSSNGRVLYDGGGIMPDSVLSSDYLSLFTASTIGRGYVEDFATYYYKNNLTVAPVADFAISDKDYNDFVNYVKDKDIEFDSKSEAIVASLRETATKERSIDNIDAELTIIENKLKERDNLKMLNEHSEELRRVLAYEILAKYYFSTGKVEKIALEDKQVEVAVSVLKDRELYEKTLGNF